MDTSIKRLPIVEHRLRTDTYDKSDVNWLVEKIYNQKNTIHAIIHRDIYPPVLLNTDQDNVVPEQMLENLKTFKHRVESAGLWQRICWVFTGVE